MAGASTAYLHYVAMMSMAIALVLQLAVCVPGLSADRVRLLWRLNRIYLGAGLLALGSGVAYFIWFGRSATFYLHNPVFYIKLALFAALGLISMPPTRLYSRWLHSCETGPNAVAEYEREPAYVRKKIHINDTPHSTDSNVSRYSLSEGTDENGERRVELKRNNPYLHDKVD